MAALNIRGLDEQTIRQYNARAALAGLSQSEYLLVLLELAPEPSLPPCEVRPGRVPRD